MEAQKGFKVLGKIVFEWHLIVRYLTILLLLKASRSSFCSFVRP